MWMNNKFAYGDDHKAFILFIYLFIYMFFSHLVQGGYPFIISYPEELPLEFDTLLARFEGLGDVKVERLNPSWLTGVVPRK